MSLFIRSAFGRKFVPERNIVRSPIPYPKYLETNISPDRSKPITLDLLYREIDYKKLVESADALEEQKQYIASLREKVILLQDECRFRIKFPKRNDPVDKRGLENLAILIESTKTHLQSALEAIDEQIVENSKEKKASLKNLKRLKEKVLQIR